MEIKYLATSVAWLDLTVAGIRRFDQIRGGRPPPSRALIWNLQEPALQRQIHRHLLKSRVGPSESCKIAGKALSASATLGAGGNAETQGGGRRRQCVHCSRLKTVSLCEAWRGHAHVFRGRFVTIITQHSQLHVLRANWWRANPQHARKTTVALFWHCCSLAPAFFPLSTPLCLSTAFSSLRPHLSLFLFNLSIFCILIPSPPSFLAPEVSISPLSYSRLHSSLLCSLAPRCTRSHVVQARKQGDRSWTPWCHKFLISLTRRRRARAPSVCCCVCAHARACVCVSSGAILKGNARC